MTDGLIYVLSNYHAAPTDTNPKNLKLAPPQSVTATRIDQLVYIPNYYIQIFRLNLLPALRIEPSTARSKLKSNALTDCAMGAIRAGPGCKRRPYGAGILQSRSHDCLIGSHECLLLFTPSCCYECFFHL